MTQCEALHAQNVPVYEASAVKLGQDSHDAARTVAILDAKLLRVGSQLAQTGHTAAQLVDVAHFEVHLSLLGNGQQILDIWMDWEV